MALPTHADIEPFISTEITAYQRHQANITTLCLVDVLVIVRQYFPAAAFLKVDGTDQDMSGSLVANWDDVLDANGDVLDTDDPDAFADDVWGPLSNLDDRTVDIWRPFIVDPSGKGTDRRLDLNAIADAAPGLLQPFGYSAKEEA